MNPWTEWPDAPVVLSYGGGVNSTALLVGLWEKHGRLPDLVLFADTGGEFPETYAYVEVMREWCEARGCTLEIVTNADPGGERHGHKSLEDECHRNVGLPSLAFGFAGCSSKWKRHPIHRRIKKLGAPVVHQLIGIDAEERHRSANLEDGSGRNIYYRPLVDWDWGRDECLEAIERAGLPTCGKSACWFCPAAKKHEVLALAKDRPELFARAVAMERNAKPRLTATKGLGRGFSWEELVAGDRAQLKLFPEPPDADCGCYDGEE